jgi:hypothetical protein
MSASDDTIHCNDLRLYSIRTAKLYNKKEIVSNALSKNIVYPEI